MDVLLATHEPKRYAELARAARLPSQVFAEHERGTLAEHLRGVHEHHGEELRRRFRERPLGERVILGLAYASGTVDEPLRAPRAHPHYPARASWTGLTRGLEPHQIARIASAIVPGVRDTEQAVQVYRGVHETREESLRELRRRLIRLLRERWPAGGPELVTICRTLTHGMSPEQVETLRIEAERDGDVENVWTQIEVRNLAHRMEAVVAAFRRWLGEWEHARDPNAQTPLQEPQAVPFVRPRPARPAPARVVIDVRSAPQEDQLMVLAPEEPRDEEDDEDDVGVMHAVRAPSPAAHTADGQLPWAHLTQGFDRRGHEELRRSSDDGRSWDVYRGVLARRGAETEAAREAELCRRLQGLGCPASGPCRIEREQLAVFAEWFSPEHWAWLAQALVEGAPDPLEVWREIEGENLAETISIREPAFLRFLGASDRAPRWNPAAWALWAPAGGRGALDPETAGLVDDIGGALGGAFGAARGGGGGDLLSGIGQGLGSLFGGGGPAGVLSGLGGALGSLFGGGHGGGDGAPGAGPLFGHLGEFAQGALGALTGRRPSPPHRPTHEALHTPHPPRTAANATAGPDDGPPGPGAGRGGRDLYAAVARTSLRSALSRPRFAASTEACVASTQVATATQMDGGIAGVTDVATATRSRPRATPSLLDAQPVHANARQPTGMGVGSSFVSTGLGPRDDVDAVKADAFGLAADKDGDALVGDVPLGSAAHDHVARLTLTLSPSAIRSAS